ncbi:MAG: CapA family protein [Bacteroidota bacterium]|nr:CapA family protein [Bacteroidota bacterium]
MIHFTFEFTVMVVTQHILQQTKRNKTAVIILVILGIMSLGIGVYFLIIKPNQQTNAQYNRSHITVKPIDSITRISIVFAGDIMSHLPQTNSCKIGDDKFDYSDWFEYISLYLHQADLCIANLETTLAGKPYSGYPQFSAPDTLAWFIKQAGFNYLVTANNHSADRSSDGISRTIEVLDKFKILHTGTYLNDSIRMATTPSYVTVKGIKIALMNYTYGTNGIPVRKPVVVSLIDTIQIGLDIAKAKKDGAEIIIPIFHWGLEYQREANAEQKAIAKYCLVQGVSAIIGSHPHVLQPLTWYGYQPVIYSLGNYVSNQRKRYTDGGGMLKLSFTKVKGKVSIVKPAKFLPTWVYLQIAPMRKYQIVTAHEFNKLSGNMSKTDKAAYNRFLIDTRSHMHLNDSNSGIIEW